ncbi:MAG: MAPEG family protein [Filomicrobium sp.]
MTIPLWVLLGYAAWTLLALFATVGVYRWSHILTGRTAIAEWRADEPPESDWYRRAVRAHMNCLENLPIYTAIVVVLVATRITSPILDGLAITILGARVCQTLIHVSIEQTNTVASFRFAFFFLQAACMVWMGIFIAVAASS